MRSMTGYGRGVAEHGDVRATVDIRAVNHRFLDLKLRGAAIPAPLEDAIATRVRGALERGSVTVSVNLARGGGAPAGPVIDGDAAVRAHRTLSALAARLGVPGPDLALVLAQPGVVTTGEPAAGPGDDDSASSATIAALGALGTALGQLGEMRRTEGQALAAELRGRLDELVATRTQLAGLAAAVPQHLARRLVERVRRLTEEVGVDDARVAQEIALHADRADITEELVRLASHLDQARALIDGAGAVGRRLDFLVQEIGRELNTIGSKSATAEITTAIVGAKATLEKIREQVQNVE
ncbi:MAG TPA: YicC/YloC family endoribonuclease [Kofleriaceae bacterium]|jgi:uncharacterized protein (TIGR00255 family)|nr:YicC/YloC family endoribonuclease [Kofleriaceae bacterium]